MTAHGIVSNEQASQFPELCPLQDRHNRALVQDERSVVPHGSAAATQGDTSSNLGDGHFIEPTEEIVT